MTEAALQAVIDRVLAVYGGWGPGTSIETMRRDWDALFAADAGAPDLARDLETVDAGGVPAAWIGAQAGAQTGAEIGAPGRAILFFHGGGFQVGSIRSHRTLMAEIAAASGCRVLGVDYRLAPEHRFPAPVEDALAAYDWLIAQGFAPGGIALVGDSAGGGLACRSCSRSRNAATCCRPRPRSCRRGPTWRRRGRASRPARRPTRSTSGR